MSFLASDFLKFKIQIYNIIEMKDILKELKKILVLLGQFADYGEGYFIFPRLEGPIGPENEVPRKRIFLECK